MASLYQATLALLLVVCAAYVQGEAILRIGDVNPNLTLIAVIVLSFFIARWYYTVLLILVSAIFLIWQPGVSYELIVFVMLLSCALFFKELVRWQTLLGCLILIGATTFVFLLLIDPLFLFHHPLIVFGELAYNVILGGILMMLLAQFERRLI